MHTSLKGVVTALITPFVNQTLDEAGLQHNIRYQIAQGVNGILVLGSTGESPTLSAEEQTRIIALAVAEAAGKVPVWVGTGTNCTRQTIEKTRRAAALGADVALVVVPYYNKPTQEGLFRHFAAVSASVEIPIVVYNIPGRCVVNLATETLLRIANLPNVIGIKDSSTVNQSGEYLQALSDKHPDFLLFSGDDPLTLPLIALGAAGVVSVVSNLIPHEVVALVKAALAGQYELARQIHDRLLPLFQAVFLESNPIPIKTAMNLCGLPAGECRLPLCEMAPENLHTLQQLLSEMQLSQVLRQGVRSDV